MTEPVSPIEQTTRRHSRTSSSHQNVHLPRITIKYCTQCKWMLRAAYFAQELLSTFGTTIGEVALVPVTGGIFTVTILHPSPIEADGADLVETLLWDRKTHGGFPEVKQLKALVRNIADPTRSLGHVDRALDKANQGKEGGDAASSAAGQTRSDDASRKESAKEGQQEACEDCQ